LPAPVVPPVPEWWFERGLMLNGAPAHAQTTTPAPVVPPVPEWWFERGLAHR